MDPQVRRSKHEIGVDDGEGPESDEVSNSVQSVRTVNLTLLTQAQIEAESTAILLKEEVHKLWHSWSWRFFRPARNLIRERRGLGKETEPRPESGLEALRTITRIHQSLSWELTAPLRLLERSFARWPRFDGSRITRSSQAPARLRVSNTSSQSHPSYWQELIDHGAVLPWRNGPSAANHEIIGVSGKPKIAFVSHEATRTGAPRRR